MAQHKLHLGRQLKSKKVTIFKVWGSLSQVLWQNSHRNNCLSLLRMYKSTRKLQWVGFKVNLFSLKIYPELYVCSAVKDACISEMLWIPEGGIVRVWNLRFYRAFEDWELAASYSLLQLIQTHIPRGNRRDTLYW